MTLTCRRITELVYDFVHGELTAEISQHVQIHLDNCQCCFTLIETYRVTIQAARQLPQRPLPESLQTRLAKALSDLKAEK